VGLNPTQSMHVWFLCVSVFVCACVFCVSIQVEALRRADHPPRDPTEYPNIVNRIETESFMEVGQGQN
jgi:hypothetical protein